MLELYVWRESYETIHHKYTNTYNQSGLKVSSIRVSTLVESGRSWGNGRSTFKYEYSSNNKLIVEIEDDKHRQEWKYDSNDNVILYKLDINGSFFTSSMMFYDSKNRLAISLDEESGRRSNGKPRISIIEYKNVG